MGRDRACKLSSDYYALGVSAKCMYIVSQPLQRKSLVSESEILVHEGRRVGKAEYSEAVADWLLAAAKRTE